MISFRELKDALINALLPPRCVVCEKLSEPGSFFCSDCEGKLKPCYDQMCKRCAGDKNDCDCDRFIYHFDGAIAPFKNDGDAKDAFYSLKFGTSFSGLDYFSEKMAEAFKATFSDVKIDLACFVPLSNNQLYEREFDKCELFAQRVSKILNIPLENLVYKRENVPTQHNLTMDNRFDNVRNAYRVKEMVRGKKILLIDDIKTTGATLDACARELKFAGAKEVYCLTALSGQKD